ncbi:hypothetical protein CGC54_06395 [Capnocytophaga canimorsus]|uniref:Uncharacterized protein n=1 Tax=Capnocytophaga canimorsus TaxID=28188 RepID=A0AAC9Z3P6_9FLAO|nr:hypothetical protein [Capnocytophaga canimorsus]ATA93985.1 hypothetical protein CGC54_06395 [Capnocytophaga canimorsus]
MMNIIKEIEINHYPEDNTPVINVFDNGTSFLLFEEFPMDEEENYFSEEESDNFEQILSELIGVKVVQEDRGCFVLMTNDLQKIQQVKDYLEGKKVVKNKVRKNLRAKEINTIIQEQTEAFFKQEGFKYVKKDMAYVKKTDAYRIEYGFTYLEYHPEYMYDIVLFVQLTEVEKIYLKIRDGVTLGNTFVFKLSYFLDIEYWFNYNPKWRIRTEEDIPAFSQALIDSYTKYVKDFIPFITQSENMLNFLLEQITTEARYANDENVLIRALILMKLLNYPMEEQQKRLAEFKSKLANAREDLKQEFYRQMDDVVAGNW